MPKSGRLVLTKAVLSTIPAYTIIASQLPVWAIEEIDKLRRKFLWADHDCSIRGKCLVSWPIVCLPTAQGGLGVVDFRLAGIPLCTCWMWLQRTDPDRAWATLPVHVEPEVRQLYEASILIQVDNGAKTLFWTDSWTDCWLKKTRTAQQALSSRAWVQDIIGDYRSRPSFNTSTSGIALKPSLYNQTAKTPFTGAGRRMANTPRTLRSSCSSTVARWRQTPSSSGSPGYHCE
jgi:hypothetical protein